MGIMDKANEMKDKAKDAVGTDENVDKAADKAKDATGDKYDDTSTRPPRRPRR